MSAISWLWGSSGFGPNDTFSVNDRDPVAEAREAAKAREERLKDRETRHGQLAEQDYRDQQAAREAELTSVQIPPGVVLRNFPEVARHLAEHGGAGLTVVAAYGPGDGASYMRDAQRLRDEGIAQAIAAGELPPNYLERTGAAQEVW